MPQFQKWIEGVSSDDILTVLGGRTSHAAVVARQMNKVCIVGCRNLVIERNRRCRIGGQPLSERDFLSLDGHSGAVYSGKLEVVAEKPVEWLALVEQWRQLTDAGLDRLQRPLSHRRTVGENGAR